MKLELQAAIQSLHNRRSATGETHWPAVARAAAHREVEGAAAALLLLDELTGEIGDDAVAGYQPYWVVRALCEHELGRTTAPEAANRAVALTTSPRVAAHLRRTLA